MLPVSELTPEQLEIRRADGRKAMAAWRKRQPREKIVALNNAHTVKRYGITVADYNRMLVEQNGVCKVCRRHETKKTNKGTVRRLSIDHCHDTGKVRGLLCHTCNVAIGYAGNDPARLRAAADYLERSK